MEKDLYFSDKSKGLANNIPLPTKPELSARSDDFAVTATPL
jgi:hypothetical protein